MLSSRKEGRDLEVIMVEEMEYELVWNPEEKRNTVKSLKT